ncbi:MAG: hypothetical protein ACRDZ2_06205, partial [Ilumatobacteraceae bacterium]
MRPLLALVITVLVAVGCAEDDPDAGASTTSAAVTPTSVADTSDEAPAATSGPSTTVESTTTESNTAESSSTTTPPTTAPALAGRTFVSTAVTGFELAPGAAITLSFEGDRIAASGGCNQLTSSWVLNG